MKIIYSIAASLILLSCSQVEEKINQTIDQASETVKQKAQETVKESLDQTIKDAISSVTKTEDVTYETIFYGAQPSNLTDYTGKKFTFPNGSPAYFLKYKADFNDVKKIVESQTTTDESKSDKELKKIDGQKFMDQIQFFEKFLPQEIIGTDFTNLIKMDSSLEFYRIKRFPNKSTIIVNPKNNMIYHFVEVEK